ncbi:GNAT family N-acetyltransferase [Pseudonocardia sp. RS11V-5]|uniref:GNAT family N-acetyltransferase n=1 Tax=Pseudonocardia terrae TaxID=2905831 RepID=UPI001E4B6BA6|nr:GNAT family N-acetyltransferase [Pseudonocardia terrae]MCE3553397.1 GNAT family N-acetyltransferase [Pseudonocardia terrae]
MANPVLTALTGRHREFADLRGRAGRYQPDVTPFAGLPLDPTAADWADLAALSGPGGSAVLAGPRREAPAGWETGMDLPGVQMTGDALEVAPDPEAVRLGPADVPEMLDLVARTKPGPFLPRTIQLGTYLGIRRDGALVAMAGERMRVPGGTEISAVCTDPAARGQGLAARLVRAVGAVIRGRGERPFLHAAATNVTAIRLYEHLGFTVSRELEFIGYRAPAVSPAG